MQWTEKRSRFFLVSFCHLPFRLSIPSGLSDHIGSRIVLIVFLHKIQLCGETTIFIALTKWTHWLKVNGWFTETTGLSHFLR